MAVEEDAFDFVGASIVGVSFGGIGGGPTGGDFSTSVVPRDTVGDANAAVCGVCGSCGVLGSIGVHPYCDRGGDDTAGLRLGLAIFGGGGGDGPP